MVRLMVMLGIVSLVTFPAVAGDATKQDQQAIQGRWRITERIERGTKQPSGAAEPGDVVFTAEKFQMVVNVKGKDTVDKESFFKLDATKKPKTIMLFDDGEKPRAEAATYGIYVLEKDTLKICISGPGKKAPNDFISTAENGNFLLTFERIKKQNKNEK